MLGLARYTSSMTQAHPIPKFLLPDESATLALGGQVAGRAQVLQVIFFAGIWAGRPPSVAGFCGARP